MNDSRPLQILETAGQVIDALGGSAKTARLAGASLASVSNWRAAGRLPPRTFLTFRTSLEVIGATAPAALWSIDDPASADATGTQ